MGASNLDDVIFVSHSIQSISLAAQLEGRAGFLPQDKWQLTTKVLPDILVPNLPISVPDLSILAQNLPILVPNLSILAINLPILAPILLILAPN